MTHHETPSASSALAVPQRAARLLAALVAALAIVAAIAATGVLAGDAGAQEREPAKRSVAEQPTDELPTVMVDGPFEFDDMVECGTPDGDEITDAVMACSFIMEGDILDGDFAEFDEMFAEFETCLADNGIDVHEADMVEMTPPTDVVIVATADGQQIIELGEGSASVTITSDGGVVEVDTTGDVEVIEMDFAAEEAAFVACDGLLPLGDDEGVVFDFAVPADASRGGVRGG